MPSNPARMIREGKLSRFRFSERHQRELLHRVLDTEEQVRRLEWIVTRYQARRADEVSQPRRSEARASLKEGKSRASELSRWLRDMHDSTLRMLQIPKDRQDEMKPGDLTGWLAQLANQLNVLEEIIDETARTWGKQVSGGQPPKRSQRGLAWYVACYLKWLRKPATRAPHGELALTLRIIFEALGAPKADVRHMIKEVWPQIDGVSPDPGLIRDLTEEPSDLDDTA